MIGRFIEIVVVTWVMSGGSREKEDSIEQQCRHCGLWFHTAGLQEHERNCDFREFDVRLQEIEDNVTLARISNE